VPTLATDRATTSYRDAGAGPPVLLLHAGASSSIQWERLAAALAPRRRALAPDLYGHGATPCPPDMTPETLLERQVAVLRAVLDLADRPAAVIGHSYGAVLALRLALDFPAAVGSLLLVEPVAFSLLPADDPSLAPVHAIEAACAADVLAGDPAGATRRFLDFWSDPDLWDFLPEPDQAAIIAGARERHFIGGPAVFGAPFTAADLASLTCPIALVTGDDGPAAPRTVAARLADLLPHAARHTIEGAGHMLPLTHHRAFMRLVDAFLSAHGSA
jgi:lipase